MITLSNNNREFLTGLIHSTIPITLPIAMVSGLFMAPWIAVIMLMVFFVSNINIATARSYLVPIEHIIACFGLLSCFWSIDPADSIIIFSQLLFVIVMKQVISNKAYLVIMQKQHLISKLTLAITGSAVIFVVDSYTHGMIYSAVRSVVQPGSDNHFELSWLDRGCAVLALTSWVLIYLFVRSSQILKAAILYIAVFILLYLSDSTSSFIAFILGGIAYIVLYFSPRIMSFLLALAIIAYMVAMPIFAIKQDPNKITENYSAIPISYAHRLFIWKFTSEKALENVVLGKGIGSSRAIPVLESDMVDYDNHSLSPLPRHPHNNILQIWLEMGSVGLVLAIIYVWNILVQFRNITAVDKNFGLAIHAVFINYFFIGMVSFNMWQSWWLMVLLYIILLMNIAWKSDE